MTGTMSEDDTVLGRTATVSPPPPLDEDAFLAMAAPGQLVGRYVVLSVLGRGGMGVVLAAYDPELDRKVAVKLVRPDAASQSSSERMIREARSMARVSHPNVVSVYDAGRQGDAVYIAMEFVEGVTLTERMRSLSGWRDALDVMTAAGEGLVAAHERDLVHRDFKPDNVMIADDGRVLVMDFGLVRDGREEFAADADAPSTRRMLLDARSSSKLGDTDVGLTRAGSMMGTPSYMPPEQFLGAQIDARADQFSFSVVLYEALFGERPFAGKGVWELAEAVTEGRRRDVPTTANVPRWLHRIVERGLQTNQLDRFPSMAVLLAELERGRRRRRTRTVGLLVAAPVLIAGATLGANHLANEKVRAECQSTARAEMLWPRRADGVRVAIEGMDTTYGARTFEAIADELDGWSTEWIELKTAACYDASVGKTMEPSVRDAQLDCLGDRTDAVGFVLDIVEEGNRDWLVFAADNVRQNSNLEVCRDVTRLAAIPKPEASVKPAVDDAMSRLGRAAVLELSGKPQEAILLGEPALADMKATEFRWGIAHAKVAVGSTLSALGRTDEARVMLEEAFFSAGALGDDEIPARAARVLAGLSLGQEPYGITWSREWFSQARMMLTRLGLTNSLEMAELHESMAALLAAAGGDTTQEEVELLRAARAVRLGHVGPDHPAIVVADINLAAYGAEEDPDLALSQLQEGRERLAASLGTKHPTMVALWMMSAEIRIEMGDLEAARLDADRGVALAIEVHGADHPMTQTAREVRAEAMAEPDATG